MNVFVVALVLLLIGTVSGEGVIPNWEQFYDPANHDGRTYAEQPELSLDEWLLALAYYHIDPPVSDYILTVQDYNGRKMYLSLDDPHRNYMINPLWEVVYPYGKDPGPWGLTYEEVLARMAYYHMDMFLYKDTSGISTIWVSRGTSGVPNRFVYSPSGMFGESGPSIGGRSVELSVYR